jgi:signal transduction histidine kinase
VTVQEGENTAPAMNETLPVTTTKDRLVPAQAPASMRVNSEAVSNVIDESDSQSEKHDEQRN